MSCRVYLHDGSIEGLLHAVAAAVKSKEPVQAICSETSYVPTLFETPVSITTDQQQARQLLDYLHGLHPQAARYAINGYLSEGRNVGFHLYRFVFLCLDYGAAAVQLYSDDSVRYLCQLCRKVSFEAHRLKGLIRFSVLESEMQYGPFESDYNVIAFCAHHFQKRLRDREWLLHDISRNIALYWNNNVLQSVDMDTEFTAHVARYGEIPGKYLADKEKYYRELWRSFHRTISNPDRENKNLQRQLMPRRYWKYLVEMDA